MTEALANSEEKYRNLVEKSHDGICIIQDSVLGFVNERFQEMTGYSAEELGMTDFRKLIAPESLKLFSNRELGGEMEGSGPEHYEIILLCKNGERMYVEVFASTIHYEGSPAIQAALRDISERKKLENEKKEKLEELQRWYKLTVDRELKLVELKKRLKELEGRRS